MKRSIALGLLVVLATAGCAASDLAQTRFTSAADFAAVVAKATGWSCATTYREDAAHTADSLAQYGFISVPCSNGAASLIESDAKRAELAANPGNKLQPGSCRLDGGNWSVSGAQYDIEAARKAMGGTLTCA